MGKLSKALGLDKKGNISITLHDKSYYAGALISGVIHVTVTSAIKCDALVLKASGKEWTCYTDQDGKNRTRSLKIFSEKTVITKFTDMYQPGKYTYPFEYQLPENLPGVFKLQDYGSTWAKAMEAEIKYALQATLEVDGFLARDIRGEIPLRIHECPPDNAPVSQDTITKTIRFLGVMNKGACTLSVKLDKSDYSPGGTARVQCNVENNSEVPISVIRCRLAQMLVINGAKVKQNLASYDYKGVAANKTRSATYSIELRASGNRPRLSATSSCGQRIRCEYRIKVECDIAKCPDVVVRLPVRLAW